MFLQGSFTALATPFTADGVDEESFETFVDWQIGEGTDGLVPCGTTGEDPTLTEGERDRLIRICVACAAGSVPVIAGTGTNCTATTIARTRAAKAAGADAALIVTPPYNRPSQEGLFRHFAAVAAAVDLPIILGNAPGRTGVDLATGTVEQLAAIPAIVGLVDASGDPDRPRATALAAGPRFARLCGSDAGAVAFALAGGRGCLSAAANVVPALCRTLQRACRTKHWDGAREMADRLAPLVAALGREPDPGPVKHALSLVHPGFSREPRLPMVAAGRDTAAAIGDALAGLGLAAEGPAGGAGGREGASPVLTVWRAE